MTKMASDSHSSRRRWLTAVAVVALVGAAVGYWAWPGPAPVPRPKAVTAPDNDLVIVAAANPGYVGSQACAACHAARVNVFKQTRHHWACTAPEDRPMPVAFETGGASFASSEPSIRFAMTKENGRYVQKTIQTTPQGKRETTTPIGMVYGHGGQFDEVYFTWRDNRLSELPVTWLHPTKEWANVSLDPHQTGDFSRVTTTRCVECHATWLGHVPGTPNEYRRETALFGVGCERCHGPGKDHVAFHAENPKAAAHAITQPAKLGRQQRIDLCAQCHSNAAFPADLPFTYRPGEPLKKSYKTLASRFPEDDHVANQTKYMQESKCFQRGEMTCLTCHDPHKPTDHKAVADACVTCHQPAHCKEQPRLPAAVRDNCAGCHLPARVWMNVHFHSEKDRYLPPIRRYQHRIAVYPEATQEVLLAWEKGRPAGAGDASAAKLTTSLVGHWLGEADKYRKDYRFLSEIMAVREALHFDPSPAVKTRLQEAITRQATIDADFNDGVRLMGEKQLPAAAAAFAKILDLKPDSAKAHARLGTLNGMLGKDDLAEKNLRLAGAEDPNDPYPFNMLGWMAYVKNRPAAAVPEYLKALDIDPANDAVLYRLGLAYLRLERWPEARATFERLYRLNPNHAGGCQGMSHALRRQKEYAEAVRYARRAAQLTDRRHADILLSLCDAYDDAGRRADAVEAAEQAVNVADDPAFAAQLRERLAELKSRPVSNMGR